MSELFTQRRFSESSHLNHIKGTVRRVKEKINVCRKDEKQSQIFIKKKILQRITETSTGTKFFRTHPFDEGGNTPNSWGKDFSVVTDEMNSLQQQQLRFPLPMNYKF